MRQVFMAVLLLTAGHLLAAEAQVLLKFAEAEKRLFPTRDVTTGWAAHQIARGGSTSVYSSTTAYDWYGREVWSNWSQYSSNLSGTLVTVPIGDYRVESAFLYLAPEGKTCLTGLVVSVGVQLSTGAKAPTELAMQKAVKDLACTGMALSTGNGGKPMRIMSLRKSVCRRFGGKNPRPHYDAPSGRVFLLLEDCRLAKGDPTFVPATPEGATAGERERLVKLRPDADKGGTLVIRYVTEIGPVGAPHTIPESPQKDRTANNLSDPRGGGALAATEWNLPTLFCGGEGAPTPFAT